MDVFFTAQRCTSAALGGVPRAGFLLPGDLTRRGCQVDIQVGAVQAAKGGGMLEL